jgi:hypothetical protein
MSSESYLVMLVSNEYRGDRHRTYPNLNQTELAVLAAATNEGTPGTSLEKGIDQYKCGR